jgi:hypothetical protein
VVLAPNAITMVGRGFLGGFVEDYEIVESFAKSPHWCSAKGVSLTQEERSTSEDSIPDSP